MYNDYELFQMGLLLGGVGVGGVVSSLFDYLSYLLLPAVESGVVFYWYGLTLIPEWISSHMTSKKVEWNYLSISKRWMWSLIHAEIKELCTLFTFYCVL